MRSSNVISLKEKIDTERMAAPLTVVNIEIRESLFSLIITFKLSVAIWLHSQQKVDYEETATLATTTIYI